MRPGGTDNRYVALGSLGLDPGQDFVAGRKQRVDVIFDGRDGDSAHAPGCVDVFLLWQVCSFADDYEIVTPGFISKISTPGTSFCKSPGLPVSIGKVPKCIGTTVFALSRLQA